MSSGKKSLSCCQSMSISFCFRPQCLIPKSSLTGLGKFLHHVFKQLYLNIFRRTKKKDIYVISTPKRPVPLEHFLYAGRALHKIVDANGSFITDGSVRVSSRSSSFTYSSMSQLQKSRRSFAPQARQRARSCGLTTSATTRCPRSNPPKRWTRRTTSSWKPTRRRFGCRKRWLFGTNFPSARQEPLCPSCWEPPQAQFVACCRLHIFKEEMRRECWHPYQCRSLHCFRKERNTRHYREGSFKTERYVQCLASVVLLLTVR